MSLSGYSHGGHALLAWLDWTTSQIAKFSDKTANENSFQIPWNKILIKLIIADCYWEQN